MVRFRNDHAVMADALLQESSTEPSVGGGGANALATAPIVAGYVLCLGVEGVGGVRGTGKLGFEAHIFGKGRGHTTCLHARLEGVFVISEVCAIAKHFKVHLQIFCRGQSRLACRTTAGEVHVRSVSMSISR